MNEKQREHINLIIQDFKEKAYPKYEKGVMEHGGNIWDMNLMELVDCALEEAIDSYVYLTTIKELIRELLK